MIGITQNLHFQVRPISEDVGVGIDETGQDRGMTEVKYFSAGGYLDPVGGPDFADLVILDEYELIGQEPVGFAIKKPTGANGNPVIGGGRRLGIERSESS